MQKEREKKRAKDARAINSLARTHAHCSERERESQRRKHKTTSFLYDMCSRKRGNTFFFFFSAVCVCLGGDPHGILLVDVGWLVPTSELQIYPARQEGEMVCACEG